MLPVTLSLDNKMLIDVVNSIWGDGFYSARIIPNISSDGEYEFSVLHNSMKPHGPLDQIEILSYAHEPYIASLDDFYELLKISGLPFRADDTWVAWNPITKLLEVEHPFTASTLPLGPALPKLLDLYESHEFTARLLGHAEISTDHGMKPLLISVHDLSNIEGNKIVGYPRPTAILEKAYADYLLATVTKHGEIKTTSLESAVSYRRPIATRQATYYVIDKYIWGPNQLFSAFQYPALLGNAFRIAFEPEEYSPTFFKVKDSGTAYESPIVKLPYDFENLPESSDGFVTNGCHPLDVHTTSDAVVTTIDLFHFARSKINELNFHEIRNKLQSATNWS